MIYDEIQSIVQRIKDTEIFPEKNIVSGQPFTLNAQQMPFCIIKSGSADINSVQRSIDATVHIMALFHDNVNIEKTVNSHATSVYQALVGHVTDEAELRIDLITFDADILEPFGLLIEPVPPYGGFRMDVRVVVKL